MKNNGSMTKTSLLRSISKIYNVNGPMINFLQNKTLGLCELIAVTFPVTVTDTERPVKIYTELHMCMNCNLSGTSLSAVTCLQTWNFDKSSIRYSV